jgi:hypothetical protein
MGKAPLLAKDARNGAPRTRRISGDRLLRAAPGGGSRANAVGWCGTDERCAFVERERPDEPGAAWTGAGARPHTSALSGSPARVLRGEVAQLAGLRIKPGIPEIKRILLVGKCALESGLSFGGYTPGVSSLVEQDCAGCFSFVIGQVRCLGGHWRPPKKLLAGIGRVRVPVDLVGELWLRAVCCSKPNWEDGEHCGPVKMLCQ